MSERGGELVTADKSTIFAEPSFDAIVVEDSQSGRCFTNPASTDQSDWREALCESDNLLDQLAAPKEDPRWGRW